MTALMGNSTYPWCPDWSQMSPRNAPTPASGWAEGLSHLPLAALWSSVLGVLSKASCLRVPPPQVCERSCISLAYASLETGHASPVIYPKGGCGCRDISVWCNLLPCSASQYSSMMAASKAHWCPSLASQRASSHEWSLPQV